MSEKLQFHRGRTKIRTKIRTEAGTDVEREHEVEGWSFQMLGLDLLAHHSWDAQKRDDWSVTEMHTGLLVSRAYSRDAAIEQAREALERYGIEKVRRRLDAVQAERAPD